MARRHLVARIDILLEDNDNLDSVCITDDFCKPMSRLDKRDYLLSLQENGDIFLDLGNCPEFDPKKGCPGHE